MVLKIRGGIPLVWRSPSSLQFGVDDALVVLEDVHEDTERLVAALVAGISPSGFEMMARGAGIPASRADELLEHLSPVLDDGAADAGPHARVLVTGDGMLADELRTLLSQSGVLAASEPDLAVVVAGWLVSAQDHGEWLRRDIPHVPVVLGDRGVTVGPFVEPGSGPCLYCMQLSRTDADPAWPAMATQLWGRPAPAPARLAIVEAAAFATRRILRRLETGPVAVATSWQLLARDGAISPRVWSQHPACRCSAPPESDWAPAADRATPSATTTSAAAAVPA